MTYLRLDRVLYDFYAEDMEQMERTIRHYQVESTIRQNQNPNPLLTKMPLELPEFKIEEVDKIYLQAVFPQVRIDQHFLAPITPNFDLRIYSNAFEEIRRQFLSGDKALRGGLYKLQLTETNVAFLPKEIFLAGRDYNWMQHHEQILEWERDRERSLQTMDYAGHFQRRVFCAPGPKEEC